METEETRHYELMGRLTVERLDLEKYWTKVNAETPLEVIEYMSFKERVLDTLLVVMVKRGRAISPEAEEYTHRGLTMITVILEMERNPDKNYEFLKENIA